MADPTLKGFKVTTGRFLSRNSLGVQSVSGLDFEPELVLFIMNSMTGVGYEPTKSDFSIGAMSSSEQVLHAISHVPLSEGAHRHALHDNTKAIGLLQAASSPFVRCAAEFESFNSDGFSIDWTTVDGVSRPIDYMAMSGLRNVKFLEFNAPTSTGNHSQTGVGFQPKNIIFLSTLRTKATLPILSAGTGLMIGNSFDFSIAGARGIVASMIAPKTGYGNPEKVGDGGGVCLINSDGSGSIADRALYQSFDSDGFTLNWTNIDGQEKHYTAICFEGAVHIAGIVPTPTETGEQENVADRPYRGILTAFLNVYRYSNIPVSGEAAMGVGFFDLGPQVQHMRWFGFDGEHARQNFTEVAVESRDTTSGEINMKGEVISSTNISATIDWTIVQSEEKFLGAWLFDSNLPLYASSEVETELVGSLERERGLSSLVQVESELLARLRVESRKKGVGGRIYIPRGSGFGGKINKG